MVRLSPRERPPALTATQVAGGRAKTEEEEHEASAGKSELVPGTDAGGRGEATGGEVTVHGAADLEGLGMVRIHKQMNNSSRKFNKINC